MHGLVITGTNFPHRTTQNNLGVTLQKNAKQIDHLMICKEWRRSVDDTGVFCGEDAASDQYLLVTNIKLKLHENPDRAKINAGFDTQKLENEMFKSQFNVELCNRFAVLQIKENINEDCILMEHLHRNCRKSTRSIEEKQAMVEGRNLESNRPTADDL